MNYLYSRSKKHDRSLSLDVGNDLVSGVNLSHLANFSEIKNPNLSRMTPQHHGVHHDSRYIFEEHILNSNDNSPLKPVKSLKLLTCFSQPNSAMKTKTDSKPKKLEKTPSVVYFNPMSDVEQPVSRAIQIAYDLQMEREKELQLAKVQLEKEVKWLKLLSEMMEKRISVHQQGLESKQKNINFLNILTENGPIDPDDCFYVENNKRKELINTLTRLNRALIYDYKTYQSLGDKRYDSNESNVETNISSISAQSSSDNLQMFLDEKNLMIHKMETAEEKLNQARETQHMIEEDFNSRVVSTTECIFLQEETENIIEGLKMKYHQWFDAVQQEIEICEQLEKIEKDIESKENNLAKAFKEYNENQMKFDIVQDQYREMNRILENIDETCKSLLQEICKPEMSMAEKLRDAFRRIPITNEEVFSRLESFFSVFDLNTGTDYVNNPELCSLVINYQIDVLDEALFILKAKKDISNLESTLLKLHSKSPDSDQRTESPIVIKSLQGELVNKKLALTQRAAHFDTKKKKSLKQLSDHEEIYNILSPHSEQSFFEVNKRITAILDPSSNQKVEQILLILLNSAKDTYNSYYGFKDSRSKVLEKVNQLNDDLTTQNEKLETAKAQLEAAQQELEILKKDEEALKKKQAEIKENFESNYVKTPSKTPRKGDGEQEAPKLHSRAPSTASLQSLTPRKEGKQFNAFNKLKREIMNAFDTIKRAEATRALNTQTMEEDLKPNFEKARHQVAEYNSKLAFLNKEMINLIEKELEYFKNFDKQIYELLQNSSSEEELSILNKVYVQIQEYLRHLSDLMCTIIEKSVLEDKPEKTFSIQRSEVYQLIHNHLDRLHILCEVDGRRLNEFELELSSKKDLKEKEQKLAYIQDQIQKSKHFYEVTDQLLKSQVDKENCSFTSNYMSNNSFHIQSSGKKKLLTSKSSSRLQPVKENYQSNMLLPSLKLNFEIQTPKPLSDSRTNISGLEASSTRRSLLKTHSTATLSTPHNTSIIKTTVTDRSCLIQNTESLASQNSHPNKERIPKYLSIETSVYRQAIKELESGIFVLKKFATGSAFYGPKASERNQKNSSSQDLKGFGKRNIRLNIQGKCLEIIKPNNNPNIRIIPEYTYEWKNIKKVFIPAKTLDYIKKYPQNDKDGKEFLAFSIDVQDKGRIDFLVLNSFHIVLLWNVVNNLSLHGNLGLN